MINFRKSLNLAISSCFLTLFQIFVLVSALPAQAITKPAPPPCRIDIGDVHPSTYLAERHKLHTIKVYVDSLCDQPLRQVHIHVLIFKTGFPQPHLVKRYDNPVIDYIPANKKYLLRDVVAVCTNWKVTNFYAEAYGDAIEIGC